MRMPWGQAAGLQAKPPTAPRNVLPPPARPGLTFSTLVTRPGTTSAQLHESPKRAASSWLSAAAVASGRAACATAKAATPAGTSPSAATSMAWRADRAT
jgi:hypothetical protein